MSMHNAGGDLRKAAPYEEIRGGRLNQLLLWPARVLICMLAVLVFLSMSNPAQTALLGRATLAGLGLTGEGTEELVAAETQMSAAVDALDDAAGKLLTTGDGLVAAGGEMTMAKNALKDARDAMTAAQAALDGTLGAEVAACEAVLAQADSNALTCLVPAAEAVQAAVDAQAAVTANPEDTGAVAARDAAVEAAMYLMWEPSIMSPETMSVTDGVAMLFSDAMWYEPFMEGDPTREEKMAEAIAAAQTLVTEALTAANTQAETLAADKADAEARMAGYGAALPEVQASIDAALAALDEADAAVKAATTAKSAANKPNASEEVKADAAKAAEDAVAALAAADKAMEECARVLRAAEDASAVAGTGLKLGQADALGVYAKLLLLAVAVGLAGMIMSLGNNRMRKLGLPVLLGGAAAAVVLLLMMHGVHGVIADNVAVITEVYGVTPMPEALTGALDKLALDIPDALWVCVTVAALTALCALAAWLTLPRKVEAAMQIDLLTIFMRLTRVLIIVTGMMVFFPGLNPGRVSVLINENMSLFTVATSYGTLTNTMQYALTRGMVEPGVFYTLMAGAAVSMLGILLNAAGACMSLGNNRMKKKGLLLPLLGSMAIVVGLLVIFSVYNTLVDVASQGATVYKNIQPMLPAGLIFWAVSAVLVFLSSFVTWYLLPDELEEKMEMEEKYRNFLMFLPVLILTFIFAYLPIYGWRFAFFDYKIGDKLLLFDVVENGVVTQESNYVGLKWFTYLFQNKANLDDLVRVLRNTLIMSGLGIATSWLPIAFAVMLAEVRSSKFQRVVQTLTTIPNFISWVLVYAIAFAIFSTDGFINSFLRNIIGVTGANTDYLASADFIWLKMLLWGTWKGLGWSAIVYIAGIAGIDQQLYEAARVDGANRFQCIRHITIPGLIPTYMVMLLMSVAGMLSNGMDQYLVFENAINKDVIEVLDLYVYNIGIKSGLIPLSTVVGVFKSLIGVTLLFGANGISKAIRGESII